MASEKKNDIEAGNPVELTPTDTDETPKPLSKTITNLSERLSKQVRSMLPSRKPHQASTSKLPGDIGLTTMACILRSLVIADDMVGVSAMIRLVEDRNFDKTEAFTIQDVAGNGLLQIAALKNRKSMTETLLKEGFDINYVDDNHGTALQAAIYMDSREVSDVLLDKEWNINVETTGGYYGCALQVATYKGSDHYINLLLGRGIKDDVCIPKSKYGTSLQAAARTGVPSIVEKILKLNFDVNAEFGVYGGALQAAAKGKYTSDTEYLRSLSRGHVLREDTGVRRQTSKDQVDYLEVAKILVEKKAKVNASGGRLGSPINAAASSGDPSMLEFLLDKDKNSSYDDGQKKAMYNRALLSAITQEFNKKRRGLVEELIRGGADVDCEVGSSTPLAAAAAMNDLEVVKYLLEKVKDKDLKKFMDAKSGIYGSALHAALSAPKPADQTALHLIKKGANLSKEEHKYGNILHLAAFANLDEVVQLLLKQNEPKVEIDALDNNDQTALHIAAYRGYHKVVDVLLKSGATANMKDVWGNTPLHIVEDELENDGHPVPSLHDLRKTKEKLLRALVLENKQQTGSPVEGPYLSKKPQASESLPKKAKPVFESPQWNPGLKFRASIVDFLDIEDREHIKIRDLLIDDLLYKDGAIDAKMDEKGLIDSKKGKLKLRWIHLPANNVCHNSTSKLSALTFADDLGTGILIITNIVVTRAYIVLDVNKGSLAAKV
jgi:ankyrin repeat protein